jgi:bacterioferritin
MAVTQEASNGFPEGELAAEQLAVLELLTRAYWMEIETVMNYIAATMSTVGARNLALTTALTEGVEEEVAHARALGRRIQELHGVSPVPGGEQYAQGPARPSDTATMIEAVVATESSAIRHYQRIMRATSRIDQDTHALALSILRDEQRHLRLFEGYRHEFPPAS